MQLMVKLETLVEQTEWWMQASFSSFSSSFTKIDLVEASFNEIVSVKLELSIRTVLETSNSCLSDVGSANGFVKQVQTEARKET